MKLREHRQNAGLTQDQVATALGMPKKTYQNYEREVREADSDVLCAIADLYGVTLDELVGREPIASGYKDECEIELVSIYRGMSDEGKKTLLSIALTLSGVFGPRN